MWVGLLFSMMSLSAQFQQFLLAPTNTLLAGTPSPRLSQTPRNNTDVASFREKIIQCLILGHYTEGGPYVLETLLLYSVVELFPSKDAQAGIHVLVGSIVQIAMRMGYHRDAKYFPNISPFIGEMRRRIWALIVQLDFSISTQMGLPRLVKESQVDVAEPRNLTDSDFDEHTLKLPSSRPETEMTPTLYTLAKLRLLSIGSKVADVATKSRPCSYGHVLELNKQIDQARDTLPSIMKWDGLTSCLTVSSHIIIQRIWLEVSVQRLKIVLHRKLLVASRVEQQYSYSLSVCLTAATKILEFQHLVDEEKQIDGRLYQSRWRVTFLFIHDFLLATSVFFFYLQAHYPVKNAQQENLGDAESAPVDIDKIRQLLRISQVIWNRESETSKEARKAAAALHYVLGDSDSGVGSDPFGPAHAPSGPSPEPPTAPFFSGELLGQVRRIIRLYTAEFPDLMSFDYTSLGLEPENEELCS